LTAQLSDMLKLGGRDELAKSLTYLQDDREDERSSWARQRSFLTDNLVY